VCRFIANPHHHKKIIGYFIANAHHRNYPDLLIYLSRFRVIAIIRMEIFPPPFELIFFCFGGFDCLWQAHQALPTISRGLRNRNYPNLLI